MAKIVGMQVGYVPYCYKSNDKADIGTWIGFVATSRSGCRELLLGDVGATGPQKFRIVPFYIEEQP
jgi:hypothetical protein